MSGSKNPGFDPARLDRIPAFLKAKYVDTGRLPHAATLVSRGGEIAHLSLVGEARPGEALKEDAIAKGANPPSGVPSENIVKEADLPWTLRVIRPTDGIANYVPDPNRLTLVLSEDGRIVDAGWI